MNIADDLRLRIEKGAQSLLTQLRETISAPQALRNLAQDWSSQDFVEALRLSAASRTYPRSTPDQILLRGFDTLITKLNCQSRERGNEVGVIFYFDKQNSKLLPWSFSEGTEDNITLHL